DLLLVNGGSGATISAADASVAGKLKRTLTWTTAPANVSIELLWSKVTMGGNWMINTFSVPFDATCGAVVADTEIPTAFSATKGTVTPSSVELLLNATDNSGSIGYTITYGTTTLTTTGTSGVQKSYVVTGLTASTAYSFSVTAKDGSNNAAANNPQVVSATTSAFPSVTNPTVNAANVMSVYSGTYTNLPTIMQNWYGNTFTTVSLGGNEALKNTSICCFGYEFTDKPINVSAMTKLHVDIYSESLPSFTVGVTGGGEFKKSGIALTAGQWNSIDILLSDLTGANLAAINQIGFWDLNGTFYLDNLYFYNENVVADTEAPTAFSATAGTITADEVQLLLNATDNSGLVSYSISYGSGPTVVNSIGTSGVQKTVTISGLTASTAYNFSVTAKDATGNTSSISPIVVQATTLSGIPAAPTPLVAAANVISAYSDTYTNLTVSRQNWYGNTFTATMLGGNEATKNVSICCFGFEFAAKPLDVSAMTKLHVDIYPTTLASMSLGVTDGADKMKNGITLTANQWNSVDVTLSELNANLANVNQIGFWNLNGTFYFDNLYFYTDATTGLSNTTDKLVRIYPNPATSTLSISAQSEINAIKITNLVGQTIKNVTVNALERVIDLNEMSNGQYIISLSMKDGQIVNQKFIKK
ncbi:MAG: fibronectin type III domain-containing protein, partial [Paludibacter sp.]